MGHYRKVTGAVCLASAVAGCSFDARIAREEVAILRAHQQKTSEIDSYQKALDYGKDLTDLYLKEASRAAAGRDIAFFGVVGLAGISGLRVIDGAGTAEMAQLALGGAALGQSIGYLKPGPASAAMVQAANRAACVTGVGASHADVLAKSDFAGDAAAVMVSTLDAIRTLLRQQLTQSTVDFSKIADTIQEAAKKKEQTPAPTQTERDAAFRTMSNNSSSPAVRKVQVDALATLKAEVAKCPAK